MARDYIKWSPVARVDKFDDDQVAYARRKTGLYVVEHAAFRACKLTPYETVEVEGNQLTTAGLGRLSSLLIGAAGQAMTNTATRLGVGDDTTAFNAADTDLGTAAGAAYQYYMTMDATYPQQSNGVVTVKATFATGDGNFAWQCWGIDIGAPTVTASATPNTPLVNRKVASLGTKSSGSWVLTCTLTFS